MDRLTETNFDKQMRIGFALMDRHIEDGIKKLDDLKKHYERKLYNNATTAEPYPFDIDKLREAMRALNIGCSAKELYSMPPEVALTMAYRQDQNTFRLFPHHLSLVTNKYPAGFAFIDNI